MRTLAAASLLLALSACYGEAEGLAIVSDEAAEASRPATINTVGVDALAPRVAAGEVLLVDVRTPEEFSAGHIPGAINMPVESFDPEAAAALEAGSDQQMVLYCRSGNRSLRAAEMLAELTGEGATHLEGGITAWEAAGEPVER